MTVFFTTHYMEEAERIADRIAVVDHGRIVAQGTAVALRQETGDRTLADAFIALTGHSIREADAARSTACAGRVRCGSAAGECRFILSQARRRFAGQPDRPRLLRLS